MRFGFKNDYQILIFYIDFSVKILLFLWMEYICGLHVCGMVTSTSFKTQNIIITQNMDIQCKDLKNSGVNDEFIINVLDMFAGAGGLSEGFTESFNIVSHIEMNGYAAKTFETRALYHVLCRKPK